MSLDKDLAGRALTSKVLPTSVEDKSTGMIFDTTTTAAIIDSYIEVNELIKSLGNTKNALRDLLEPLNGEEHNNHQVKVIPVQRMNYDIGVLRSEIDDEGLLWEMLQPNKAWIDNYLKENLEDLGGLSTTLRKSMVELGKPYTIVKVERVSR